MVYRALRWVTSLALSLFYRWTLNGEAIPVGVPLVIVGNHQNALIDPIAVMRLTPRPVRFLAKAPIFEMPVIGALARGAGCLPVYRKQDDPSQMGKNDETFKAAHAALLARQAICIFPEGKSHSGPALEPLKTGAARIALGAEDVQIVPVGFAYREKGIFRSEVLVEIGAPMDVADFRPAFEADPLAGGHALTDRIAAELERVTVNLDSWADLPLVEAAQRLYRAERGAGVGLRPFAEGLAALRESDPPQAAQIRARILSFARHLEARGLAPEELDEASLFRVLRWSGLRLLELALGLPIAGVGLLAFLLPYQVPRWVARLARPEEDLLATIKLGVGIVVYPLWIAALAVLGFHEAGIAGLLIGAVGLPLCGLFSLWFFERFWRTWADARAFLLLVGRGSLRLRLLARRKLLADELDRLAERTGVRRAL